MRNTADFSQAKMIFYTIECRLLLMMFILCYNSFIFSENISVNTFWIVKVKVSKWRIVIHISKLYIGKGKILKKKKKVWHLSNLCRSPSLCFSKKFDKPPQNSVFWAQLLVILNFFGKSLTNGVLRTSPPKVEKCQTF